MPKENKSAEVVSASTKHSPVLTEGELSPYILTDWRTACGHFFEEKDVAEDKKVKKVVGGLRDPLISDWYANDSARLKALTFSQFFDELAENFLPEHWAEDLRNELMNSRQTDDMTFRNWVVTIEKKNAILRGTPSHLNDAAMRAHLEIAVCPELTTLLRNERTRLVAIVGYRHWKNAVIALDTKRVEERERFLKLITNHRVPTKQTITSVSKTYTPANVASGSSSTKTDSSGRTYAPTLTPAERQLLNDHSGCTKCRRFYVKHDAKTCPNSFPDGRTYKTLRITDALAAKQGMVKKGTVAAVTDDIDGDVVAAVRADSPLAGVIGDGTDSSDDGYVLAPLSTPHITWRAVIRNESGSYPLEPTTMLIDSASPTVLIRSDIVAKHNLRVRELPNPYPLGNAWGAGKCEATTWVKLQVSSPSLSWSSIVVRAVIVPRLCAPVILGRPFLKYNSLLEDHVHDALIDERTGIDILAPSPPPGPKILSPPVRRRLAALEQRAADAHLRSIHAAVLNEFTDRYHHSRILSNIDDTAKSRPLSPSPHFSSPHTLTASAGQPSRTNLADAGSTWAAAGGQTSYTNHTDSTPMGSRIPASQTSITSSAGRPSSPISRTVDDLGQTSFHNPSVSTAIPFSPFSSTDGAGQTSNTIPATTANLPSPLPPLSHVSSHHDSLDPPDNDLTNTIASVRQYLEKVNEAEQLTAEDLHFKKLFSDIFPSDIPHVDRLPTTVFH